MNEAWYRFFQNLWLQVSSGLPNNVTLANTAAAAAAAQQTANNAATAVTDETARAEAAEANLQGQINTNAGNINNNTNNINSLNSRFGSVNTFGGSTGAAGALAGYLNIQVNGANYVLQLYNT
jgi:hypothetical protein